MVQEKPSAKCQIDRYIGRECNGHKTNLPLKISLRFQIPKHVGGKLLLRKKEKERKEYSQHNQQ